MKNLENYTQATDFTTLTHIITTTMAEYFYLYFAECRTLANQKLMFKLHPSSGTVVVYHLLNVAKGLFHSMEKTDFFKEREKQVYIFLLSLFLN